MIDDDDFETILRGKLDRSISDIDDSVSNQLQQARKKALESISNKPSHVCLFPNWVSPLSASTAFAIVFFMLTSTWNSNNFSPNNDIAAMQDIALLNADDDLELYKNMDFYLWLELDEPAS